MQSNYLISSNIRGERLHSCHVLIGNLCSMRPIESLLDLHSVASHAPRQPGRQARVTTHGYQTPPPVIRSPSSTPTAVRARINTAGPISTCNEPDPPDNHRNSIAPPIAHRDIAAQTQRGEEGGGVPQAFVKVSHQL